MEDMGDTEGIEMQDFKKTREQQIEKLNKSRINKAFRDNEIRINEEWKENKSIRLIEHEKNKKNILSVKLLLRFIPKNIYINNSTTTEQVIDLLTIDQIDETIQNLKNSINRNNESLRIDKEIESRLLREGKSEDWSGQYTDEYYGYIVIIKETENYINSLSKIINTLNEARLLKETQITKTESIGGKKYKKRHSKRRRKTKRRRTRRY
jgi:hypothetical protein